MKEIKSDQKLGRGLSVLLGNSENRKIISNVEDGLSSYNKEVRQLSINNLVVGIYQPRKCFDQDQLLNLSNSIREHGIIQPIIARRVGSKENLYEIIAGERRFRAAKMASLKKIPVIIVDIDDNQALKYAIIENVQRSDLSLIEEARGYKRLMDEFGYTQVQIAKDIGKSRSHVANILRLLSLPEKVMNMVDSGKISFGHAKVIAGLDNIEEVVNKIIKNNLSVREVEDLISIDKRHLKGQKSQKDQSLVKIEEKLSIFLSTKVKAEYNPKKKNGKITIFYKDLRKVIKLVDSL